MKLRATKPKIIKTCRKIEKIVKTKEDRKYQKLAETFDSIMALGYVA